MPVETPSENPTIHLYSNGIISGLQKLLNKILVRYRFFGFDVTQPSGVKYPEMDNYKLLSTTYPLLQNFHLMIELEETDDQYFELNYIANVIIIEHSQAPEPLHLSPVSSVC